MERAERSGGLHKRSAEAWGNPLRARGAELPFIFFNISAGALPCILRGVFFSNSYGLGNRATISDSRSNFHTRVGYRTNVCRRRLASDLARGRRKVPAQGLSRITMTGYPAPHSIGRNLSSKWNDRSVLHITERSRISNVYFATVLEYVLIGDCE